MRKRIVSLFMVAATVMSLLTGCGSYSPKLPTGSEEADIFVAPVEGLSEDFIKGMDISSVIAEEESGVVYYDENGKEEDLFKILADSGVNYIRVRVWNDPYDEDGNGYGGGNNDVEKAATIGKRAAKYGMQLLTSASEAVRQVSADKKKDIQIAVHYTEIDNFDDTLNKAQTLQDYNVDYDIFGVSYYPYWHGTMDNMTSVLTEIKEQYGKETCILETSYLYTGEDGDDFGNSVSAEDALEDYPVSVQGQASCIRDVIAHASEAGALGVFYWEGAWIPVESDYESNTKIWEEHGSGWASSFAKMYDPLDAGKYYGGCSWDNQAFFDFEGHKLPSLDVFKYVNYGATCEPQILAYREVKIESGIKEPLVMPETVSAIYNDPSITDGVPVTWDEDQVAAIDTNVAGEYTVEGTTEDGTTITASIKVLNVNYVQNPSFEESDVSMWAVDYPNGNACTDIQTKAGDAVTGEKSFHFYSEEEQEFTVEQTITGLAAGDYTAVANIQGGDVGDDAVVVLYVLVGDERYESEAVVLDGWVNWKKPQIKDIPVGGSSDVTVGMYVKCAAKGWGTIDDFEFYCQTD